ncbi:phosphomannomutase [Oceanicola sp. D3]|uniref:phosphomannomutase n=1 Tax=Oceanicola sp. D3 TaxID=2587163 RepID=UPI001121E111|nr:phosphomannomutase [Oceanicola sp. D3]QDC08377.1 phosphomannomutase [Oceanicola sp. D3]
MTDLSAFKAYDIRGQIGVNLDSALARKIGRAFAEVLGCKSAVIGRDIRPSSPEITEALTQGLIAGGVDVIDIGLVGTEEVYFATSHLGADGGLMVTASHNPIDYNGIKMVAAGSRPLSADGEMERLKQLCGGPDLPDAATPGKRSEADTRDAYAEKIVSFVDVASLKPLKILVNAGNGVAGPSFDAIAEKLAKKGAPLTFERMHHEPDASFPNGIPNPLLPENQPVTGEQVKASGADMGVAWDGDFDRCFLCDEAGDFVEGEFVVALLAKGFLQLYPGANIVHDTRVAWNSRKCITEAGGTAISSPTGHSLIKALMRKEDAVYGGEISAHHYFRDFYYCDSGMIPWLTIAQLMSVEGARLSEMVADMRAAFPSSGEINFRLGNPEAAKQAFEAKYAGEAEDANRLDGLSLEFADWRVNLRSSNTEPVLRLNVETRGDRALLDAKVAEISALIRDTGEPA